MPLPKYKYCISEKKKKKKKLKGQPDETKKHGLRYKTRKKQRFATPKNGIFRRFLVWGAPSFQKNQNRQKAVHLNTYIVTRVFQQWKTRRRK